MLRKIARKQIKNKPINFTEELITYEAGKSEIWCLIGNPGCGNTFLAKRTALRFSLAELTNISYSNSDTMSQYRLAKYAIHKNGRR